MKQFTHALLTRFNVGVYSENPYKVTDPDEWMRHRIDLFKTTVRSVRNQFVKPDGWVIEIDKNTPDHFWKEIIEAAPFAFVDKQKPSEVMWKPRSEWLITTRLDNDDLILPNFIESIQSQFQGVEEVIDFKGLKRNATTGEEIPANRTSPSPFISLIEPWRQPPKTVLYQGGHARIGKKYPVRTIDKNGWIQVCHDRNVINKFA